MDLSRPYAGASSAISPLAQGTEHATTWFTRQHSTLAICIKYFDTTSYEIQEKFFKFTDDVDVSGENTAHRILQELDRLNLDISYCRGQAYDRGSDMSGKFKGVQVLLQKYSHCANHRLNLAISKACSVVSIRNAIGVIASVSNFFRKSAGRIHKLETEVQDKLPRLKKGKHALKKMGSNAFSFLHAIQSSEFLVSVVVLAEVFGLTLPLARKLQAEYMDVLEAMKLVEATLANLREQRYKSTDTFKKIFRESEKLTLVGQIQKLLSPEFSDGFEDEVLQGAEPYKDDLPCFSALKGELLVWKQIWKSDPSQKFPQSPGTTNRLLHY
ncbi:hypothetical protein PR048_006695 [Dryococelus australis]|uniref:Zinc finger MYM-type 1-like protein n=1 Tax=Dryococelus australis TaxID=614101 RepID=A0ABQ9ICZ9_9NEOP|nr:hypothetical protein PR048_006695 [Dryococelus australis]